MDADQSSEIEMYRQIHSDLFNMLQEFLGGIKIQIKFTSQEQLLRPEFQVWC